MWGVLLAMSAKPRGRPRLRFAAALLAARTGRAWSLRELSEALPPVEGKPRDYGNLGKIERGERGASREFARDCDRVLGTDGQLLAAWIADDEAWRAEREARRAAKRAESAEPYGRPAQLPSGPTWWRVRESESVRS